MVHYDHQAPGFTVHGSANTYTCVLLLGLSSGVRRLAEFETSELPVVTATYCLPPTPNTTGKPLTGAPRFCSQRILPLRSSKARKRPLASPPRTSPPAVATSESMPARCSYFQ